MKVTACYAVKPFLKKEELESFIKMFGLTVLHHYTDTFAEVYIVEDANKSRMDLYITHDKSMHASRLRLNVENIDEAIDELSKAGWTLVKEPREEWNNNRAALMNDPHGERAIIYQHN